ncbi:hypothetical protein D5R81_18675 [Parashewanella spongiae]|uniref:Uncharacterized protein n=1 Tax=Parashewanella spongiae TaxID=342950 RepID=A0A3A6TK69_9GAMM|nr:ankyrin repeat domain-containing protein [Parashewanella spongiae]MCL1080057.1 ankyrin repeat domain-containing protein [Parashewanella spongiae]RJY05208.1 hypothetical protein D5R81_18675 [Parashewanella spongiae]
MSSESCTNALPHVAMLPELIAAFSKQKLETKNTISVTMSGKQSHSFLVSLGKRSRWTCESIDKFHNETKRGNSVGSYVETNEGEWCKQTETVLNNSHLLHYALWSGNEQEITRLLAEPFMTSYAAPKLGYSLLMAAIMSNNTKIVKMLLDACPECNFQHRNRQGESAVFVAIRYGKLEILKLLLNLSIDLSVTNQKKQTPLLLALASGKQQMAECLIEKMSDINGLNLQDNEGTSALHLAVMQNFADSMVPILIEKNCDTEAIDSEGDTPLTTALLQKKRNIAALLSPMAKPSSELYHGYSLLALVSYYKMDDIALELAEHGHKLNIKSENDRFQLIKCIQKNNEKLLLAMLANGFEEDCFRAGVNITGEAVKAGNPELAHKLISLVEPKMLDLKFEVSYANKGSISRTTLSLAMDLGDSKTAEALILKGAILSAKTLSGYDIMNWAVLDGHSSLVDLLLSRSVSCDEKFDGRTPLQSAIVKKNEQMALKLISHTKDINTHGKDGSALVLAAHTGQTEVVKVLISNNANVEATNTFNRNFLMLAIPSENDEITPWALRTLPTGVIQKLLSKQDINGYTCLTLALTHKKFALSELLLEKLNNVNVPITEGDTPLMMAIEENQVELAKRFIELGASVNAHEQRNKFDVLMLAISKHNFELAQWLVENHGDSINWSLINIYGRSHLSAALFQLKRAKLGSVNFALHPLILAIQTVNKKPSDICRRFATEPFSTTPQSSTQYTKQIQQPSSSPSPFNTQTSALIHSWKLEQKSKNQLGIELNALIARCTKISQLIEIIHTLKNDKRVMETSWDIGLIHELLHKATEFSDSHSSNFDGIFSDITRFKSSYEAKTCTLLLKLNKLNLNFSDAKGLMLGNAPELSLIQQWGIKPDVAIYCAFLSVCAETGHYAEAESLVLGDGAHTTGSLMQQYWNQAHVAIYNAFIMVCAKTGQFDRAWQLVCGDKPMMGLHLPLKVDSITCLNLLTACVEMKRYAEAKILVLGDTVTASLMLQWGIKPNVAICNAFIMVCAKTGQFDSAWQLVCGNKPIMAPDLPLKVDSITCVNLLTACAEAGRFTEAKILVLGDTVTASLMLQWGIKPDVAIYNAFIKVCIKAKEFDTLIWYLEKIMNKCNMSTLSQIDIQLTPLEKANCISKIDKGITQGIYEKNVGLMNLLLSRGAKH